MRPVEVWGVGVEGWLRDLRDKGRGIKSDARQLCWGKGGGVGGER